jgi:Prokaryotic E2 family E
MGSPADRLRERLDLEEPVLLEAFPTSRLDRDSNTVTLLGHRLPAGWSHEITDVLFGFPSNYPAGCPDNVSVRRDLRVASGELPANNQGVQTHAGRDWLQLSWHIDATDWAPTADPRRGSNLATYLIGALMRFDEAS